MTSSLGCMCAYCLSSSLSCTHLVTEFGRITVYKLVCLQMLLGVILDTAGVGHQSPLFYPS